MDSLDEQLRRVKQLQADIGLVERRLSQQMREMPACAVAEIPGIGLLAATAVVASMGTDRVEGCPGVCCMDRPGPSPDRNWWTGTAVGHQLARRCLPANVVDARCSSRRDQIQGWADMAMADRLVAAPALQRGCRRGGEQAGADDLGGAGARPSLAPRGVAGRTMTTKKTEQPS